MRWQVDYVHCKSHRNNQKHKKYSLLQREFQIRTHILPVLLQKGHKEVDAHLEVLLDLLLVHRQVTHSNTHAKNLLELELDCSFCLVDLGFKRFRVTNQCGELSCSCINMVQLESAHEKSQHNHTNINRHLSEYTGRIKTR